MRSPAEEAFYQNRLPDLKQSFEHVIEVCRRVHEEGRCSDRPLKIMTKVLAEIDQCKISTEFEAAFPSLVEAGQRAYEIMEKEILP